MKFNIRQNYACTNSAPAKIQALKSPLVKVLGGSQGTSSKKPPEQGLGQSPKVFTQGLHENTIHRIRQTAAPGVTSDMAVSLTVSFSGGIFSILESSRRA